MRRLCLAALVGFALPVLAQTYYVNTNTGVSSLTTNLPTVVIVNGICYGAPTLTQLAPSGWCSVSYQQPASSNYTATAWWFSNSSPGAVAIYVSSQVNNSSNIVAQWLATSGFMASVSNFYTLLYPYTGSSYTGAVVNTANTLGWIFGESRTNSSFTLSNINDAHWCLDYAPTLNSAPGNPGGTTATFPWGLWWRVATNGYPLQ